MKQKQMQAVPLSRRRKLLQLTPGQIAGKLVVYGFLLFIFIVTFLYACASFDLQTRSQII